MPRNFQIVWIQDIGVHGVIEVEGAHASLVKYSIKGIEFAEYIENEDLITRKEVNIKYEEQ